MKNQRLFHLISIAVIFVFIVSLFTTVNVLADDGTPPAPTEEPVQPPTEESTPEQALSEEPSDEGEPDSTSTPEADSETTPAEILDSVPESVDVVVLDENGEAMPLTTEEAANIILSGDPIWCPDISGVPQTNPVAGNNGCTPSETTFTQLLIHLNTGAYTGDGTIFVAYNYSDAEGQILFDQDYDPDSDLDDDISLLGNLTIQGGWDFGVIGTYEDHIVGNSTLDGTWLFIDNWTGNVTVRNLFIDNSTAEGLVIDTAGNVNLDYVDIDDSDLTGAWIKSGSSVTVQNSSFTENGDYGYFDNDQDGFLSTGYYEAGDGIYIKAVGNVTLNQVTASYNAGHGAEITAGNVEIAEGEFAGNGWGEDDGYGAYWSYEEYDDGVGEYEYNETIQGGSGLYIDAAGDIDIEDICVCSNAGTGTILNANGNIFIENSGFGGNGVLGYFYISNEFLGEDDALDAEFDMDYTAGHGLQAYAEGNITLTDVYAIENANDGANLYSENGNISVLVESDDYSEFAYNGWYPGFFEEGPGPGYGYMEYFLIDAEDDPDYAFCEVIDEYYENFFNPCEDYSFIEVQGPNFHFDVDFYSDSDGYENSYEIEQFGGDGLSAYAYNGSITLTDVYAHNNGADGAYLDGYAGVSVTASEFSENGDAGYLSVCEGSAGTVDGGFAGGCISFSYADGLEAYSHGNVTLNQVIAESNAYDGANVSADGTLVVGQSQFNSNGEFVYLGGTGLFGDFLCDAMSLCSELELPVSGFGFDVGFYEIFGMSGFELEGGFGAGSGLSAYADGNITLSGVEATDNLGSGADLYSALNISVSDSAGDGFSRNGDGISGGFEIEEDDETSEAEVYISNGSGLLAYAGNDITIRNVTASENTLHGAELYSDASDSVFVEKSEFNDNGYYGSWYELDTEDEFEDGGSGSGLYIESGGNVTLTEVSANGNYQDGAEVYSNGGRVIVSCGHYNENGDYGIYEDGASSLELYGNEIEGNGYSPDEYYFSGSLMLSDDCLVPETEKDTKHKKLSITCEGFADFATFALPNGDFAVFPCPINDSAFIQQIAEDELPGGLAEGQKFLSALKTHLTKDGSSVDENDRSMKISFLIPEGVDKETLAILYWNGTEWMDLGGEVSADGLYFEISTNFVGTFVLVSK